MKQKNHSKEHNDIVETIHKITKAYPNQTIASHLAIALNEYVDFSNISDKELLYILEKYKCEKDLDLESIITNDLSRILLDGTTLSIEDIYQDDEDDY